MKLAISPDAPRKQLVYNRLMSEKDLEKEIAAIKARNKRVETDKAWETSWTRRLCIMVLTYAIVVLYQASIAQVSNVFLSSLVPVMGFLLSTLSLKLIRKIWEKRR